MLVKGLLNFDSCHMITTVPVHKLIKLLIIKKKLLIIDLYLYYCQKPYLNLGSLVQVICQIANLEKSVCKSLNRSSYWTS